MDLLVHLVTQSVYMKAAAYTQSLHGVVGSYDWPEVEVVLLVCKQIRV